ncbi:glycoside hydrolase N-terminal domain-containing protein [Microbacterium sp. NPDC056234]|uniref:glycosyl hydrolase family 95 catalytic domain-containing protein n=1 Tax=Microbacterium sp. NPDC056234 TaxID=3345757 RepID=UPI0035DBB26D
MNDTMVGIDPQHAFRFAGPAPRWIDGLPLGNGRIGMMCIGDSASDRFILNHDTAWSGSPASEFAQGRVSREQAAAAIADARGAVVSDPVGADDAVRRLQERYTQSFMPFATLTIETISRSESHLATRTLDLRTAEHTLVAQIDGGELRRSAFVSHPDEVAVVETRTSSPQSFRISLDSRMRVDSIDVDATGIRLAVTMPVDSVPKHDPIDPPQRWDDSPEASVRGIVVLAIRHDGVASADADSLLVVDATELDVILGEGTTFTSMGLEPDAPFAEVIATTVATVATAKAKGVERLRADHRIDHAGLYERATMSFTHDAELAVGDTQRRVEAAFREGEGDAVRADPALAALLWHYGRYLLIASSRPGTLPSNLQGLWSDEAQPWWSSNFTTNINVQMNYWGAEVADLPELHEPLFDLITALSINGAEVAERLYGAGGWTAHHNTDPWAFASPVGMGTHSPKWAFWPMAGLWLIRHLMEHVRHGAGEEAARRAWPLVHGAVTFALDWSEEIEPGEHGTMLSTSPEVNYVVKGADGAEAAVARSATMDLELLLESLTSLVELAEQTGNEDDPLVIEALRVLPLIPKPGVRADGATLEWRDGMAEPDPWQPHVSLHYGLFPGARRLSEEELAAASRSLDLRGGDEFAGWPLVWRIALRARLKEAERVRALLARAFPDPDRMNEPQGFSTSPFSAYPWFQMDASLGFVGAFAEALLQSHSDRIELLPALPSSLPDGEAIGLVVRPGVKVDLTWVAGRLERAVLQTRHTDAHDVLVEYDAKTRLITLEPGAASVLGVEDFRYDDERGDTL